MKNLILSITMLTFLSVNAQSVPDSTYNKEISILVTFKAKPDLVEKAKEIVLELVKKVNKEKGNVNVIMSQDPMDETKFMFLETFVTKQAEIDHTKYPYMAKFYKEITEVLDGPSQLSYWHIFSNTDGAGKNKKKK